MPSTLFVSRVTCAAVIAAALLTLPFVPIASGQQPWDVVVNPTVKPSKAPGAVKFAPKAKLQIKEAAKALPVAPPKVVELAIEEKQGGAADVSVAPQPPRRIVETGSAGPKLGREYCASIADAAAEARFAWQKKMLADIELEIDKRIALLEARTAEYRQWLTRRDEFSKKAHDGLIRIYSRMRPDAAAIQLAAIDEETAAALLTKLEPRNASAILNEMEPAKAARLTATISGAAKVLPAAAPKAQDKPS